MNFEVQLGRTIFPNPVLAASGTFGFGLDFPRVANAIGGIVTKAITVEPRAGNPPPRIYEFPGGIINSVGLENPGLKRFRAEILPRLARLKSRLIVNIAGFSIEEFGLLAESLSSERVDGFEVNVSCPNVAEGGALFGQDPKMVERVTRVVRQQTDKTVIVKLTANFIDPVETAKAALAGGADAVTLINTLFGLALQKDGTPFLGGRTGGISGPAIKHFALFCVDRVARAVAIPVIGCGGIMNGQDALDFISAGARLVQVGTASLRNPYAPLEVWCELRLLCRKNRFKNWADVIGRTGRSS
ncbi:MAG: dihydroorotate dehydrogenase [candidate division WOR-3 bacterium]